MKTLILSLFLVLPASWALELEFFHPSTGRSLSLTEFLSGVPETFTMVFGEFHYDEDVQQAQAMVMEAVVNYQERRGEFSLGWEFLNHIDQVNISDAFFTYFRGWMDEDELLKRLFPTKPEQNRSYLPLFRSLKKQAGELIATNATRETKQKLMESGWGSLSAELRPPNMRLGESDYFERFKAAMGTHIPPEKLKTYFLAQSYTDAVIAWKLTETARFMARFLVIGSFHSDYNQGVVSQLKEISQTPVVTVKLVSKKSYTREELIKIKTPHEKYGAIADFIVLIK